MKQRKINKKFIGKGLELLNQIYHNTKEAKIKDHCRAIILRSKSYTIEKVSEILNYSQRIIKDWSKLILEKGIEGLLPKKENF